MRGDIYWGLSQDARAHTAVLLIELLWAQAVYRIVSSPQKPSSTLFICTTIDNFEHRLYNTRCYVLFPKRVSHHATSGHCRRQRKRHIALPDGNHFDAGFLHSM